MIKVIKVTVVQLEQKVKQAQKVKKDNKGIKGIREQLVEQLCVVLLFQEETTWMETSCAMQPVVYCIN